MKAFVEVHRAGRPSERHEIGYGLVWVGLGKTTLMRLEEAVGDIVALQLQVFADESGAKVHIPDGTAAAFSYEGRESRSALVAWGGEVYFDGARLAFTRDTGKAPRSHLAAIVILLGAAALALQLMPNITRSAGAAESIEPPPLFPDRPPCPVAPEAAARRAVQSLAAGRAKQERFPFARSDGVAAAHLYGEALACFAAAGRVEEERTVRAQFEQWTSRINEEYRTAHLALSLALENDEHREALRLARELRAFLGERNDAPYVEWLAAVVHKLERETADR